METFVNTFFEKRLDRPFDLAERVEEAFSPAGLDYRIVGGLATYLYVEDAGPDAGRLPKASSRPRMRRYVPSWGPVKTCEPLFERIIAVQREDLDKIAKAAAAVGLEYATLSPALRDRLAQLRARE